MLLLVCLALTQAPVRSAEVVARYGDANRDGAISVADVLIALRHIVGLTAPGALAADVAPVSADGTVGDGRVTVADALALLRAAVSAERPLQHHLTLTLSAVPVVSSGDRDVQFALRLTNTSADTVRLTFPTQQELDVRVAGPDGGPVWTWSESREIESTPRELLLKAGETREWSAVWPLSDLDGPPLRGRFTAEGWLPSLQGELRSGPVALTMEADPQLPPLALRVDLRQPLHGLGEQVVLTLTAANQTDRPVTLEFASGFTHDFRVFREGQPVWRLWEGVTPPPVVPILTWEPGEAKTFEAVWNQTPNLSQEPGPPPSTEVEYSVVGELPASSGVLRSEPAVFRVTQGVRLAYLPDPETHFWSFSDVGRFSEGDITLEPLGTETRGGRTYGVLSRYFRQTSRVLLRTEPNGDVYEATDDGETLLYRTHARVGESWTHTGRGEEARVTLVSRTETLETPFGTLENCLRFEFDGGDDNDWVEWLAPGVGPAAHDFYGIAGLHHSYRLKAHGMPTTGPSAR